MDDPGSNAPAIEVTGLTKAYGTKVVLDGLDLRVEAGTVFAMLGPNGAGKTTVVQILSTLITADGGTARIAGHDIVSDGQQVRSAIGVVGQFSALDQLMTAEENLRLMADLNHLGRAAGRAKVTELLERFELAGVAKQPATTFSGGMKRRLDLAMTLVGNPEVIFLDEPTTGLDPRGRREMWTIIRELVAGGSTIFLTTQYLDEADQLADRIGVLDKGTLIAEGTADELKRRVPGGHVLLRFTEVGDLRRAVDAIGGAAPDDVALTLQVPSDGSTAALRRLLDQLDGAAAEVESLSFHTPDLDDVFFALTGEGPAAALPEESLR